MSYTALFATPFAPSVAFLGAVLLLLIVPVFAVAALAALLLVGVAIALALAAAAISAPFLLVRVARTHGAARSRDEVRGTGRPAGVVPGI
jgi:hypothetical protein